MSTRKDFIAASSLFALAPAAAAAASPSPKPAAAPPELRFAFDRATFNAILAKPARHKQCFGATKIAIGNVIDGMDNTIEAYEQYLGEAPGSVHTVAVLYHGPAFAIGLNDKVWNDIIAPVLPGAPADLRDQFEGFKAGLGNPYASSVAQAVAKGSSFFLCHNAIVGMVYMAAKTLKQTPEKVHAAVMNGVLPGALVVPAGVMAVNACQEAKFTYIQWNV